MSLRVWLPLTKDLRQQGLSNVTVTNYGATLDNNGKLGKCYLFDGTDDAIGIGDLNNICPDGNFSFACWFYKSEFSSKGYDTIFGGPSGFELETKNGTTNSNVIVPWNWGKPQIAYEFNKWYHLVMTRTSSGTTYYLNGEQVATGTAGTIPAGNYFIGAWNTATQQNYKGKLNDVRIYDHCLSPMEVKELAKGLVLHYPLNRQGWGLENLILESHKVTGGGNASGITRTYESDGSMKIVSASGNGNWCSLSFAKDSNTNVGNNMAIGDVYCISCDVKIETGTVLPTLFINSGNGYKQLKPISGSIVTGQWIRVYYNSTWADPGTGYGNISLHLGFSGAIGTYYFKNFKLEKNSIPTPWCPNVADDNNMGLNSTTEYDCSGFCNNGTRTGAFTWTGDTPKYSVSTYMPKAALITHPRPVFGGTDQEWTCAMWVKLDNVTQGQQAMNNFNISNNIVHSTTPLLYLNDGTNDYYMYGSQAVSAGVWTHVVFVFKNSDGTRNVYINGVLKNNYGPNKTSIPKGIPETVTVGTNLAGYISDYRVYATALSADDVKSLYQNSAYIDSSGNVYGAVH